MDKLPCKNCISFAICNSIYQTEISLPDSCGSYSCRKALEYRCELLKQYIYQGKEPNEIPNENIERFGKRVDDLHKLFEKTRKNIKD